MASEYSLLAQYQQLVNPYNMDVMAQAMAYKQSRIDANRDAINSIVDNIAGTTLLKEADQEYLNNRLSSVAANVNNKYRNMDLSDPNIARTIQSELSTAMDDKVLNAYNGTIAVQRLQDQVDKIRTNKPDQYSDINYQVAMAPVYQWLGDGQAGTRLQTLSYSPYRDVNKLQTEALMKRLKEIPERTVDMKDGYGNIVRTTMKGMTPSETNSFLRANLSAADRNQMTIEAQYSVMQASTMGSNAFSRENASIHFTSNVADMKADIRQLEKDMEAKKDATDGSLEALRSRKEILQSQLSAYQSSADELLNNFSSVEYARQIMSDSLVGSLTEAFGNVMMSETYMTDQAYWNRQNVLIKENEFMHKQTMDYMNIDLKERQFAQTAELAALGRQSAENIAMIRASGSGRAGTTGTSKDPMRPFESRYGVYNPAGVEIPPVEIPGLFVNSAVENLSKKNVAASNFSATLNESDRKLWQRKIDALSAPGSVHANAFVGVEGDERFAAAALLSGSLMNDGSLTERQLAALQSYSDQKDAYDLSQRRIGKIGDIYVDGFSNIENQNAIISELRGKSEYAGLVSSFDKEQDPKNKAELRDQLLAYAYGSAIMGENASEKNGKTVIKKEAIPQIIALAKAQGLDVAIDDLITGEIVSAKRVRAPGVASGIGLAREEISGSAIEIGSQLLGGGPLAVATAAAGAGTRGAFLGEESYFVMQTPSASNDKKNGFLKVLAGSNPNSAEGITSAGGETKKAYESVIDNKDTADALRGYYRSTLPLEHTVSKSSALDKPQFDMRELLYISESKIDPANKEASSFISNIHTLTIRPPQVPGASYTLVPNGAEDRAVNVTNEQLIQIGYDANTIAKTKLKVSDGGEERSKPVTFASSKSAESALLDAYGPAVPPTLTDSKTMLAESRSRQYDVIQTIDRSTNQRINVRTGVGEVMDFIVGNYDKFRAGYAPVSSARGGDKVYLKIHEGDGTALLYEQANDETYYDKYAILHRDANQALFTQALMGLQSELEIWMDKSISIGGSNVYENMAYDCPSIKPFLQYIKKRSSEEVVINAQNQQ